MLAGARGVRTSRSTPSGLETEPEFRALTAKPRAACGDCHAADHKPG